MPELKNVNCYSDQRGSLIPIEDYELGFPIRRVYCVIPNHGASRGKHKHLLNQTAIVCVKGACKVLVKDRNEILQFVLDSPEQVLILEPECYRELYDFTEETVIMMAASENYDIRDYIKEEI